jgi:hypothetical protein
LPVITAWNGTSDGSSFAALVVQGSPYNLGIATVYPPFNLSIADGADNYYCSIMQNGTITFGAAHSSGTDGLYNGGILSPIPAEVRVDGDQNHAIAMVEQSRWGENAP